MRSPFDLSLVLKPQDPGYLEAVVRARGMTEAERMAEALRLMDSAYAEMRGAVRLEFPSATDAEVNDVMAARLDEERRTEDEGLFVLAPPWT